MEKALIIFFLISIINVIFSTARTIVTIKGGKIAASLMSGGYFAFYNIVLLLTTSGNLSMIEKCAITFICNVTGVFIVRVVEDKMRKDRLWKVEVTFKSAYKNPVHSQLIDLGIPHNYIENVGSHCIFNIYCETQKESAAVKKVIRDYDGKYFASEAKIL